MPCIKCSNNKWKYGNKGKCIYKTLEACKRAAAAIHAKKVISNNDLTYLKDHNEHDKETLQKRYNN